MEIKNARIAQMATGNFEEDQFLFRFSKYLYTTIHRTANAYWKKVRLKESKKYPLKIARYYIGKRILRTQRLTAMFSFFVIAHWNG